MNSVDAVVALGVQAGVNGAACVGSAPLCVAVDREGNALTSTNPTGGAASWSTMLVDPNGPCQISPCVVEQLYAHDDHGTRVIDSTAPGSGSSLAGVALSGNPLALTWTHSSATEGASLG
jgi:hypothetical protein